MKPNPEQVQKLNELKPALLEIIRSVPGASIHFSVQFVPLYKEVYKGGDEQGELGPLFYPSLTIRERGVDRFTIVATNDPDKFYIYFPSREFVDGTRGELLERLRTLIYGWKSSGPQFYIPQWARWTLAALVLALLVRSCFGG